MPINKRIITIWLSDDGTIPDEVMRYVSTHTLAGYSHVLCTINDAPRSSMYLNECIRTKQWAKAADFYRIWMLNEYGGIYLDADVEMLPGKNFDSMLDDGIFCGEEENGFVSNAIIGAEANHPVLKDYLGKVERNFLGSGDLVYQPGMYLWTEITRYSPGVKIYPPEYFLPYNHHMDRLQLTDNSRCIHHFTKTWIK